ncbi:MAG: response regulator transcription factor [Parvibaculum sp.]|nr:response regulator transcription factor [Parvibaculum sp.]
MTQSIRIALIDDHHMFLDGLREVIKSLDPRYQCVSFASPREAIRQIESGAVFELILCDLVMEEMNGVAFLQALKARHVRIPVLIVSGIDTMPPVETVLNLGARGFVAKSAPSSLLRRAINTVLDGEVFLSEEMWSLLGTQSRSSAAEPSNMIIPLSADQLIGPRQIEVLKLIADGYSNKRISDVLNISENTVKTHIQHIFRQLNVTRRTACVSKARSLGLIS